MAESFDALVDTYLVERWREYPVAATSVGIDGFDDKLTDYSLEAIERRHSLEDEWLSRFAAFGDDELTLDQQIDRDLIVSTLRGMQIMRDWEVWKRDPATYLGPGLTGVNPILFPTDDAMLGDRPRGQSSRGMAACLERLTAAWSPKWEPTSPPLGHRGTSAYAPLAMQV